jgi:hypothetical protein
MRSSIKALPLDFLEPPRILDGTARTCGRKPSRLGSGGAGEAAAAQGPAGGLGPPDGTMFPA